IYAGPVPVGATCRGVADLSGSPQGVGGAGESRTGARAPRAPRTDPAVLPRVVTGHVVHGCGTDARHRALPTTPAADALRRPTPGVTGSRRRTRRPSGRSRDDGVERTGGEIGRASCREGGEARVGGVAM